MRGAAVSTYEIVSSSSFSTSRVIPTTKQPSSTRATALGSQLWFRALRFELSAQPTLFTLGRWIEPALVRIIIISVITFSGERSIRLPSPRMPFICVSGRLIMLACRSTSELSGSFTLGSSDQSLSMAARYRTSMNCTSSCRCCRMPSGSFIQRLHSPSLCHSKRLNAASHSPHTAKRLQVRQRLSVEPETPAGVVILLQARQTSDE
mmetsp:Transcript_34530/g.79976  ORF Transcript_34530/g.79976 Transcript_34530/m.79976 type:complete len:207 (-) Transcript_34530:253-873(-)